MAAREGPLVGRERELAALQRLLDAAGAARGGAMAVLGEAGIGKSALVDAFASRASVGGFSVVWGRCAEVDMPVFWPWRQALGALGIDVLESGDSVSRSELFARVVDRLSERSEPVVAVLEDVHWADLASMALLRFVVGALPGLPIALVVTARDADRSPEVTELLRSLPPSVERLALTGLDDDEIADLVTAVLGYRPPAEATDRIARRSGGNPFFAREVARLHESRGPAAAVAVPAAVQQVLERRLMQLSPPGLELVQQAAIVGRPDPETVASISGRSQTDVLHGFEEAIAAGLLVADGTDVEFAHDLVREVAYQQVPVADRRLSHRCVAEAIAMDDRDGHSGEIAHHWRQAGTDPDTRRTAARWALTAARAARQRGGFERAADFYSWALEEPPEDRLPILIELGETQLLAGAFNNGRATLDAAIDVARGAGRHREVVRAVLAAGLGGFEVAMYDSGSAEILEHALDGLGPDDDALRAAALARLSLISAGQRSDDERVALADAGLKLARGAGDAAVEVEALAAWCDAKAGPDHVDKRLERTFRLQATARRSGDPAAALLACRLRVVALAEQGDFTAVDKQITTYEQTAERLRLPVFTWMTHLWRAARAIMAGDIDAAGRHADTAETLGTQAGSVNAATLVDVHRLWLYKATGEHDRLAATVDHLTTLIPPEHPHLSCLAGFYAPAGRSDDARRLLHRPEPPDIAALPKDAEYLAALWLFADATIALDDPDTSAKVYDALTPYANRWVIDGILAACCGHASHQLGLLADHLGRRDEADEWLNRALQAHRAAGSPLLTADTENAIKRIARTRPTRSPSAPSTGAVFARNGRVWSLAWNDRASTVPDSKGMRDIAALLASPGREIHVLDLVEAAGGPQAVSAGGHAGEHLDHAARTAYRRRLTELEGEIAEAEADADTGRLERLRHEQDMLAAELAGALGLAGRTRTSGDPAERARKAVTMRIRTALRTIGEIDTALAHHLDRSITTGRFCAYRPENPVTWQLSTATLRSRPDATPP